MWVTDVTRMETFEKVQYWVQELKQREAGCVIVLTGTKLDLVGVDGHVRQVPKEMVNKLAAEIGAKVVESSAKENRGVREAFQTVRLRLALLLLP